MADIPVTTTIVDEATKAIQGILYAYECETQECFEEKAGPVFNSGSTLIWFEATSTFDSRAIVIEADGPIWILCCGVPGIGGLLKAVTLSDPVLVNPGNFYAHRIAATEAESVADLVIELAAQFPDREFNLCGHSMGGAAVCVLAGGLLAAGLLPANVQLITFAAPKPGDSSLESLIAGLPIIRFVDEHDPVPLIPLSAGILSTILFPFPTSIVPKLVFGYRQVGGGVQLNANPPYLEPATENIGVFGVVSLGWWLFSGDFSWFENHSSANYWRRLLYLRSSMTDGPVPYRPVGDVPRNKEVASDMASGFMLVRLFGSLGGQGWSCNYYTATTSYATALQHGNLVAGQMAKCMSTQASIVAVVVSDPSIFGDSQDSFNATPGQLNVTSNGPVTTAHPNVAFRFQFKYRNANRRTWWIHGITNQYQLNTQQNFVPFGTLATAINAFYTAIIGGSGTTGLVNTLSGMYLRTIQNSAPPGLGLIQQVAEDPATGFTLLTLNNALPSYATPYPSLRVKGRAALAWLRGTWPIYSIPTPKQVILQLPFNTAPIRFKNCYLVNPTYGYVQPDSFTGDAVATHRTGRPYDLLRGRRSATR